MRRFLTVGLVAATSTLVRAQDSVTAGACGRAPTDRVGATIYGQIITIPIVMAAVSPTYIEGVMGAIRESLHPGPLALPAYDVWHDRAVLSAEGTVLFTLSREGRVVSLGLAATSLSGAFDRAIIDAVRHADSAQLFPMTPPELPSRMTFYLSVYLEPPSDSSDRSHFQRPGVVLPLLKTTLPRWVGSVHSVEPARGYGPSYPEDAILAHREDSLLIRFVVDESGKVIPSTVLFESGTYRQFANSIKSWLPHARFKPARIGDCAVKAIIFEPFTYSLTPR